MAYLLRRSKEDGVSPYLMHATPDGREAIVALFQPHLAALAQVCVEALNELEASLPELGEIVKAEDG